LAVVETIDGGVLVALLLVGGLGSAMVLFGLKASALDERRVRRRCAACGRSVDDDGPCLCRR
jgi:hypothetical protein